MSLLILRGLLLAAEALAISALLPLLAWATGLFLRKNAAMRHLVWLAGFGVLLALPLLALIAPPRMLLLQPAPPVPVDVAMAAPVAAAYVDHWNVESLIALAAAPLCALWLAGVAWNLLRLAIGAHGLMRLRRASTAFDRVAGCEVRLGGGPLTFGFLKPIIILPHDAPHWSRARLDAVLRHELAHVARHDSVTQWLAALACAFYWPNPLVWLAAKSLRRDAEMAADDAVLAAGVQPSTYAAELVRLAADVQGAGRFAVAMATPSSLEARVTSVLSPVPSRAGVTPMDALKLGLLGGACAIALAFARPDIAMAQGTAPVTAAPLAAPAAAADPTTPAHQARSAHQADADADQDNDPDDEAVADGSASSEADGVKVETHIHHTGHMTPQQREEFRKAIVQMKAELHNIGPRVHQAMMQAQAAREQAHEQAKVAREQALAQAKIIRANAHVTSEAWRQAADEIHEAVRQAMEDIRPYIREASKDPQAGEKIGRKVSEAMAKVQPRIDAAIARANAAPRPMPVPMVAPVPPAPPAPLPPVQ